jgi:hypothetical protein
MKRLLLLVAIAWAGAASADRLYSDGFDPPVIQPLFPHAGGTIVLPPGPVADQLAWIMGELASGETTTPAEISAHFDSSWSVPVNETQAFFASLRSTWPDAVVRDVIGVTPVQLTVVIGRPGGTAPFGFVQLAARYTGAQGITQFGVSNYFGSVMYPDDAVLDLDQAVAKFATLSAQPSLLVGRIGTNGQCSTVAEVEAGHLRATASIFKLWVLAGAARAVAAGSASPGELLPLLASELAPGGAINGEPPGTLFPLSDLATLMIGISDNTATDLVHERIGRDAIDEAIGAFGVTQPAVLTPLPGISEQFHLVFSFPLDVALDYINGSEDFQRQFLQDQVVPLGPFTGQAYANTQLLVSGTWRATPLDICAAFAHFLRLPQGSDAIAFADQALGAQSAQPEVRNAWDRVWYKGGSLASGDGYHVLTHAWMLQDSGDDAWVVIAMSNDDAGGIDGYRVQSVTGRLLQLVRGL